MGARRKSEVVILAQKCMCAYVSVCSLCLYVYDSHIYDIKCLPTLASREFDIGDTPNSGGKKSANGPTSVLLCPPPHPHRAPLGFRPCGH